MKKILTFILMLMLSANLSAQENPSTEAEFKSYILNHLDDYDPIIGIYCEGYTTELYMEGKLEKSTEYHWPNPGVAIIRKDNEIRQYNIDSKSNGFFVILATSTPDTYMKEGEKWAITSDGTYQHCFWMDRKELADNLNTTVQTIIQLQCQKYYCYQYIKVFPTKWDIDKAKEEAKKIAKEEAEKNVPSTGTGFSVSSDGYIVTSYHVIEKANMINIKGVNGDFSKSLKAEVAVVDKNNDLAILKILDPTFKLLGTIPYALRTGSSEIGETVFVLGYPLTATMGEEIKLTNGIISSKSGFQGDITSYQISAPVQPGNSGGPAFDKNGNIIGIINAKHAGAENVAYAVKVNYLSNLIDNLTTKPKLPIKSTLIGKDLSEQVKYAKEFVYIIEVN